MATDFFNREQVEAFRQRAMKAGAERGFDSNKTAREIEAHIKSRQREQEDVSALRGGAPLTAIPTERQAGAFARTQRQDPAFELPKTTEQQQAEAAEGLKEQAKSVATQLKGLDFGKITGVKGLGALTRPFSDKPLLPGAPEQLTINKFLQLKGLLSLENIKFLKGTGQISNAEQKLLADAATALDTNLSNTDFANELDAVIKILTPEGLPESPPDLTKKKVDEGLPVTGEGLPQQPQDLQPEAITNAIERRAPSRTAGLQTPEAQRELPSREDVVGGVSRALPPALGVVGGVTGSAVGSPLFGVGAIPAGAIGTTLGTGLGITAGETLENVFGVQEETPREQLKEVITEPLLAGALDLATAGTLKLVGKGVKGIGKLFSGVGDDLSLKAIRPSKSQIRVFTKKTGVPLKKFVIKKGLFEKGTQQVDELIKPIQASFDDIAIKSGKKVKLKAIVGMFDQEITKFKDIPTPEAQNLANQISKNKELLINKFVGKSDDIIELLTKSGFDIPAGPALKEFVENTPKDVIVDTILDTKTIDIGDLTKLRRAVDGVIPKSAWMQDPIKAGSRVSVRRIYQTAVRNAAEGVEGIGGRSLKDLGSELSKLYAFRSIAESQAGLGVGTLPVGLLKTIGLTGGGGALASGSKFIGGIVTVAPWLLNNPKVVSTLSQNLIRVGTAINTLPANQKARILTDVFRRMLTNLGALAIGEMGEELESRRLPATPPQL